MPSAKQRSSLSSGKSLRKSTPPMSSAGKPRKSENKNGHQRQLAEESHKIYSNTAPMPSPSSLSSSRSSSLQWHLSEKEEIQNEKLDFLESLYDTDSESLMEEDLDYPQRNALATTADFFEEFENLPEIDDISEDDINPQRNFNKFLPDNEETLYNDVGHFVDPLTGELLSSSSVKSNSETELSKSVTITKDIDNPLEEISEDLNEMSEIDLDLTLPAEEYEDYNDLNRIRDSEDLFENLLELEAKQEIAPQDDIDWEAMAKEEEAKHLRQHTVDLVSELIHKAVETATNLNPDVVLRQNLDKRKLMLEISKKSAEFEVEQRARLFLNRKVVEFFRRKKSLRSILPDGVNNVQLEMKKYLYALEHLDRMLAKEASMTDWLLIIKRELEEELNESLYKTQAEIQQFEDMVRKNLMRESRPKCNVLIEKLLSKMSQCRQEVTEIRFEMLTKQHTEATLLEKLAKLEDLGNGLTMKTFGSLQTETQALDKKIEERNVELNKLHIRVRNDIHRMAHYRERQQMLHNSIAVQRMALEELMDEKQMCRKRICQLKVERNHIRLQMSELSLKGGLLDKPALMFDYDQTCEEVEKRRDIVRYLRDTLQDLQSKLDVMSKRCQPKRLSML